jgi:hypothetical protein
VGYYCAKLGARKYEVEKSGQIMVDGNAPDGQIPTRTMHKTPERFNLKWGKGLGTLQHLKFFETLLKRCSNALQDTF